MQNNTNSPTIVWLRRDLRLSDNPALNAAANEKKPILFVFIRDTLVDQMGACPKWRLGLSLEHLSELIEATGGRLILRSGDAQSVLRSLVAETGATSIHYNRDYTPKSIERDTEIKSALKSDSLDIQSHNGALLFEPWSVQTKTGGYYRVYTPFWKSVRDRSVADPLPAPQNITHFKKSLDSEAIADWDFGRGMKRGADVVGSHVRVGEAAALRRLDQFCEDSIGAYKEQRDRMDVDFCSGLSENLTYGEISPRQMWARGWSAMTEGAAGAEHFLKEIVWREFAYHLMFHSPHMMEENWREGWDKFPWREDNEDAEAWRRGMTGEPIVDAAMREMYVTGIMHNRSRMIVASYLTKHLMVHWKVGMKWFEECLTDWDPASNAMGWQWVAGCGPDASPFFRVFNPETQADKFDPDGIYRDRFLDVSHPDARSYFEAVPRSWSLDPEAPRLERRLELKTGRERALSAWKKYTDDGRGVDQSTKGQAS